MTIARDATDGETVRTLHARQARAAKAASQSAQRQRRQAETPTPRTHGGSPTATATPCKPWTLTISLPAAASAAGTSAHAKRLQKAAGKGGSRNTEPGNGKRECETREPGLLSTVRRIALRRCAPCVANRHGKGVTAWAITPLEGSRAMYRKKAAISCLPQRATTTTT